MDVSDTFSSIAAPSEGLFKDNGSRFLAFAYPVEREEEVKEIVEGLRKKYHDARHHCFAYRLGYRRDKWRASDDGEPSGSAARPILGQIDSLELSDVLVVVVRYFGGIKLGIPGLIRAYKTSTAEALSKAQIIRKTAKSTLSVRFPYLESNQVMKVLKDMSLVPYDQKWDMDCTLRVDVPLSKVEEFKGRFTLREEISILEEEAV